MSRDVLRGMVGRVLAGLLVLSLLLPLAVAPASAEGPKPERMHPLLAQMAKDKPNEKVRVIVQGNNPNGELKGAIDKHGGQKQRELSLVRGYAVELPAKKVAELAGDPNVRWITVDAPMHSTGVATNTLSMVYPLAVNADKLWNGSTSYTGAGIGVAVLDSGIDSNSADFQTASGTNRVVANVYFNTNTNQTIDKYGHGTHVAGIIGANGRATGGQYIGVAPDVTLVNVKVSDDIGAASISDVISALEWVLQNRATYNIRIINMSLVSGIAESYLTNPLNAAVEMVWLSGVAVVVSSGNSGADTLRYAPANDPFVITVGAVDDNLTVGTADDSIPFWSSYGTTQDGFGKPEVVAPGRKIVSNLANPGAVLAKTFGDRVSGNYLRLSGTSMATPVVAGVAALALQAHPDWTPGQLKWALMNSARPMGVAGSGAGQVDAVAVVAVSNPGTANEGVALNASVGQAVGELGYSSATWNSATWNSATWNSATWNSATWNSATWNSATWNSATWNSATWNSASFNSSAEFLYAFPD